MSEVFNYSEDENRDILEIIVSSLFIHIARLEVRESYWLVLTVLIQCAA